ncbi:hypothetical protein CRG98_022413, partial [Punica granatum]
ENCPEERWAGLRNLGPEWVEPAKEEKWAEVRLPKSGRDREEGDGDGAGTGGSCPLDAATTAGMDAGGSSGRRRYFAVVDRDLTGA